MILEKELETFKRELPRLLPGHEGEWALVYGEKVDSVWKTEDDAYVAGCERFGIEPFLIKKIQANEPPIALPFEVYRECQS